MTGKYIGRRGAGALCWRLGGDDRWKLESVAGRKFAATCSMGDGWTGLLEIGTEPGVLCKAVVPTDEFDSVFRVINTGPPGFAGGNVCFAKGTTMNDELKELIAAVMSQGETEAKLYDALEKLPGHQVVVNGDTLIRQDYGTKRVIITRGLAAVSI